MATNHNLKNKIKQSGSGIETDFFCFCFCFAYQLYRWAKAADVHTILQSQRFFIIGRGLISMLHR